MAHIKLLIGCILFALTGAVFAGTYTLNDGSSVAGEPVGYSKEGVILKSGGAFLPRTAWGQFTQDSLKQLLSEAKRPQDKAFIEPFIEEAAPEQQKKINRPPAVTQPERVALPQGHKGLLSMFASPLGLVILLLLYVANIYAGYEAAIFRYHSIAVCCAVAAVLPVVGPAIMASITKPIGVTAARSEEQVPEAGTPEYEATEASQGEGHMEAAAGQTEAAQPQRTFGHAAPRATEAAAVETAPAEPGLPQPVVFRRGEFTFNRRFFETKMPGFMRMVPGEAEKDMVIYIKCARGEFVGRRIMKLTPTDLEFEVFKDTVTANEVIPFVEIYEAQIRHQDWA